MNHTFALARCCPTFHSLHTGSKFTEADLQRLLGTCSQLCHILEQIAIYTIRTLANTQFSWQIWQLTIWGLNGKIKSARPLLQKIIFLVEFTWVQFYTGNPIPTAERSRTEQSSTSFNASGHGDKEANDAILGLARIILSYSPQTVSCQICGENRMILNLWLTIKTSLV